MSDNCTKAQLKGGSLFDGIGGFPLAGLRFGIDFVWASEIEAFPISVTEKHFPNMKHLGDITKINGAENEPVDVITFGSPCQDLSVAGKRAGLEGERSCLFMEAVRIIREMRAKTNGEYPKYAIWENVPGAFSSSKGADFRAVLEEITESEIPMPSSGKWATAGMVRGNEREVAWRVLDAQYWGVPQRRKRIFLVADFRGHSASEILFVEESLRGDITQSREQGQDTTGSVTQSVRAEGIVVDIYDMTHADEVIRTVDNGGVVQTLNARMGTGGNQVPLVGYNACYDIGDRRTVATEHVGIAPTLLAKMETGGNNVPVIPIHDKATRQGISGNGLGIGEPGDPCPTITTGDKHALLYQDKIGCLNTRDYKGIRSQYVDENKVIVEKQYALRRLTPTECERLQGLPDGYTITEKCSDTARYKALGNGMAQPCVDFVISGVANKLKEVK